MNEGVILIPARFESSRFPGKPLVPLNGRPLIQWVFENCQEIGFRTIVVTDHDLIEKAVLSFNGEVLRVNDAVVSGTERINLAFQRFLKEKKIQWVLNVQGDEPMLKGSDIKRLLEFHHKNQFDISTLVRKRTDLEGYHNANLVKAIYSPNSGKCHFFTRSPVPYYRNPTSTPEWFQHVGVYLYTTQALEKFCQSAISFYESKEMLEQLRAIELGLNMGAEIVTTELQGVDSPEDLKLVEKYLQGAGRGQKH